MPKRVDISRVVIIGLLFCTGATRSFCCFQIDSEFTKVRADRLRVIVTKDRKPLKKMTVQLHEVIADPNRFDFLKSSWKPTPIRRGTTDTKGSVFLGTVPAGKYFLMVYGDRLPIELLVQLPTRRSQDVAVNFYDDGCHEVKSVERENTGLLNY